MDAAHLVDVSEALSALEDSEEDMRVLVDSWNALMGQVANVPGDAAPATRAACVKRVVKLSKGGHVGQAERLAVKLVRDVCEQGNVIVDMMQVQQVLEHPRFTPDVALNNVLWWNTISRKAAKLRGTGASTTSTTLTSDAPVSQDMLLECMQGIATSLDEDLLKHLTSGTLTRDSLRNLLTHLLPGMTVLSRVQPEQLTAFVKEQQALVADTDAVSGLGDQTVMLAGFVQMLPRDAMLQIVDDDGTLDSLVEMLNEIMPSVTSGDVSMLEGFAGAAQGD